MKRLAWLDYLLIASFLGLAALLVMPGGPLATRVSALWQNVQSSRVIRARWDVIKQLSATRTAPTSNPRPHDLIVVTDYECPHCRRMHREMEEMQAAQDISVGILHLPLSIHRCARDAARAALCAKRVGGFESMHDYLMTESDWMGPVSLEEVAGALEDVPTSDFKACLEDPDTDGELKRHGRLIAELGIRSTPTFLMKSGILDNVKSREDLLRHLRP